MPQVLKMFNVVQYSISDLPLLILGALTVVLPFLLFEFRKRSLLYYGASEVFFSVLLGFGAALKLNAKEDMPSATLAFLAALYVGARGWHNVDEGRASATRAKSAAAAKP